MLFLLIIFPSNPYPTNYYSLNLWIYYLYFFFHSVPVVVVANKKDLHMDRVVTQEEGRKLADSWKAVFLEASAKQNEVTSIKVNS